MSLICLRFQKQGKSLRIQSTQLLHGVRKLFGGFNILIWGALGFPRVLIAFRVITQLPLPGNTHPQESHAAKFDKNSS